MPALNMARKRGRSATCQSNLKTLGTLATHYMNDYAQLFPPKRLKSFSRFRLCWMQAPSMPMNSASSRPKSFLKTTFPPIILNPNTAVPNAATSAAKTEFCAIATKNFAVPKHSRNLTQVPVPQNAHSIILTFPTMRITALPTERTPAEKCKIITVSV